MTAEEIARLHNAAMAQVDQAALARLRGDEDEYLAALKRAFGLERKAALAAEELRIEEPSRSVLLRSAAALGQDCGELEEAERLVHIAMAGQPPAEIKQELRRILENVTASRHLELHGVNLGREEFQFVVTGPQVGHGFIPVQLFGPRVRMVEGMIIRTAERLINEPYRRRGGPKPELRKHLPVMLSAGRTASYAITFRLGQASLFEEADLAAQVVAEVITNIRRIDQGQEEELREAIPDPAYYNAFVAAVREIAPDGEAVTGVGFTPSPDVELEPVMLQRTPDQIPEPIPLPAAPDAEASDEHAPPEVVTGVLLAAHGGKHEIRLIQDDGKEVKIDVPDGLDDIVRSYWGQQVEAVARRRGSQRSLVQLKSTE